MSLLCIFKVYIHQILIKIPIKYRIKSIITQSAVERFRSWIILSSRAVPSRLTKPCRHLIATAGTVHTGRAKYAITDVVIICAVEIVAILTQLRCVTSGRAVGAHWTNVACQSKRESHCDWLVFVSSLKQENI